MYKCIIIDDEPHAVDGLRNYISKIPEFELAFSYTDPVIALREISNSEKVDFIFLDVNMPEISGIELAKVIRGKTNILIFTTAHTKYGYEAFELRADGYLLKPYNLSAFLELINSLLKKLHEADQFDLQSDFLFIKSKEDKMKLVKIRYEEIVSAESKSNYVHLHLTDRKIVTYLSLAEITKDLSQKRGFLQFQRSFILNVIHIKSIQGNTVLMDNGSKITIGNYYRHDFNQFIFDYP